MFGGDGGETFGRGGFRLAKGRTKLDLAVLNRDVAVPSKALHPVTSCRE